MKIVFVVGTRPELIKVAPVYKVFRKDVLWDSVFISTGQHSTMLSQLYDFFKIEPDYDLRVMSKNQSLSSLTSMLIEKMFTLLKDLNPQFVIVQGDTTTTFATSLAAFYNKIPIIHLEAGLRTHNKFSPFPEEINRKMTSTIAEYHFCPTEMSLQNLKNENITQNTYIIGNTVIDSLIWAKSKVENDLDHYEKIYEYTRKGFNKLVLVTLHRRESFGADLREISMAIKEIANEYPNLAFIYPVHLNPNVKKVVSSELEGINNVFLISPVNYDEFVYLMMSAYIIMTDSGGIQEEAPSLNKPVIVLRNTTERKEALQKGSILTGADRNKIINTFRSLADDSSYYESMLKGNNPFGDGKSADRLKKIIDHIVLNT